MRESVTTMATWAVLAFGIAALVACNGSNDTGMPEPIAPERGAAPAAAPAAPAETAAEPASTRTEIVRHDFSTQARDPFTPPRPEQRATGGSGPDLTIECDLSEDPLGEHEVEDLALIGLITGTAVPRAMFASNSMNRRAIIVTEGARVGPNCSQFISDIRDNEIIVTQRSAGGDEMRTETSVMLNTERVEAEFIPLR